VNDAVVWHELECAGYDADLAVWLRLARGYGSPVLDIGAGTGRVCLPLARAGHRTHAVDLDPELAAELRRRGEGSDLRVHCADAQTLDLGISFAQIIVPMQTIHLFDDRSAFLRRAAAHLLPGGLLAIALLGDGVEAFEEELPPDVLEADGVRWVSRPTALRLVSDGVQLERRRERTHNGTTSVDLDLKLLRHLDCDTLVLEAADQFDPLPSIRVPATYEYAGSEIVMLRRRA
jgi:SAM-dependent methyltransferase